MSLMCHIISMVVQRRCIERKRCSLIGQVHFAPTCIYHMMGIIEFMCGTQTYYPISHITFQHPTWIKHWVHVIYSRGGQ